MSIVDVYVNLPGKRKIGFLRGELFFHQKQFEKRIRGTFPRGNFPQGNTPRGNSPRGIFRGGIYRGGVLRTPFTVNSTSSCSKKE